MRRTNVLAAFILYCFSGGAALAAAPYDSAIQNLCREPNVVVGEPLIVETRLASVPALMRIPPLIARPPILLWHGFGPPASERALMEALPLDEVPAIKIYLGLPQFGAREAPGGRADLARRQAEDLGRLVFEPIVVGAAQELPSVIAVLKELQCVRAQDKIGLFGFSAGGAAVLFALAEGKVRVGTAVIVNASTGLTASVQAYERATKQEYAWSTYTRELARRTDAIQRAADIALNRPALLIMHGTDDPMLTAQNVVALRDALAPYYRAAGNERRLQLTLVDGLAHGWADSAHASDVRRAIADWFKASG
jgi:dienelactone hydrolase